MLNSMVDHSEDVSPLVPPTPITEPNEIDLEAGPGEQIQCRICLETEGIYSPIYSIITSSNRLKYFAFFFQNLLLKI